MAFDWDKIDEVYTLLEKESPTPDDVEQFKTASAGTFLELNDYDKSALGISSVDELKPEHFSYLKKSEDWFLYEALKDPKALESMSDENKAKMKSFFEKHWKDGIPDEFMARALPQYHDSVQLGMLSKDQSQAITNIAKNLKEIGAEEALKRFVNDNNSPNGDTVATYLTYHALTAQMKLDKDAKLADGDPKKLSDDAKQKIDEALKEQVAALKEIAELKTVDNYTVIDWAKEDKQGHTATDIFARYNDGVAWYNSHLPEGTEPQPEPGRLLEGIVPPPEETNVDGMANTQQQQKTMANVKPFEDKDPDSKNTKHRDKNYGSIKPKDVVDFFYEDVFLAALEWMTNKVAGWLDDAARSYAEKTRQHAREIKESIKESDSEDLKAAKEKLAFEGQNFENIDAAFRGTRDERREYMKKFNEEIENNICNGAYPQTWTTLDPTKDGDKKILDNLTMAYLEDPDGFKAQLDAMKDTGKQEKMLGYQESIYSLSYQMALTEYKHDCLTRSDWKFVNEQQLKDNPEFQKRVGKYMGMMRTGLHTAYLMDEAEGNTDFKRTENFIKSATKMAIEADKSLTEDVKDGNFKADGKKLKHDGKEKFAQLTKFLDDMQDFAGKIKQKTDDSLSKKPLTFAEYQQQLIENSKNSTLTKEQQAVEATMGIIRSKQEFIEAAKTRIEKAKKKLFGSDNSFLKYTDREYTGR